MLVQNGVKVRAGRGPLTKTDHAWLEEKIRLFQGLMGQPALELCWQQGEVVAEIYDRCAHEGLRRLEAATGLGRARIWTLLHFRTYLSPDQWVDGIAADYHLAAAYYHGVAVSRYTLKRVQEGRKTPHDWLVIAKAAGLSLEQFEVKLGIFYGNMSGGSMQALDQAVRQKTQETAHATQETNAPTATVVPPQPTGTNRSAAPPATTKPVPTPSAPRPHVTPTWAAPTPSVEPPMLTAAKEDLEDWRQRQEERHKEAERQKAIALMAYESVVESIGRFVRSLDETFKPQRRNALERERIFERLEQLVYEDLQKILELRRQLAGKWGPNGFCVQCGHHDDPHEAMGYCQPCFKAGVRKGTPAIKQYLQRHPRPKKRT